jgi:hypothetical protein
MAKSKAEIAAEVRAGGNLPGGMVFDPRASADEQVRSMTTAETREQDEAEKAAAKLENKIEVSQPVSGGPNVEP